MKIKRIVNTFAWFRWESLNRSTSHTTDEHEQYNLKIVLRCDLNCYLSVPATLTDLKKNTN